MRLGATGTRWPGWRKSRPSSRRPSREARTHDGRRESRPTFAEGGWSVAVAGASARRQLQPRAGSGQKGEDFADGALSAGGFRQRQVRLDLVAGAAARFLLYPGAGLGPGGGAAVGAALRGAPARPDGPPG